ncbi:MAG: 4,5-DOPA dioxygenase extradiol [Candidatus Riflebacteria bacterium]|nr:4,5-DOPA dioxygenase extradiol [Candidatus Riflebacteria bacterium]
MSETEKMPILFVGHGSPMNAIEDNAYTKGWEEISRRIPKPEAILAISAHWYTNGSRVADAAKPKTIYDMYGFPDSLYKVTYNAPGAPELANLTKKSISRNVQIDNTWGIDHGTWSVLHKMYPKADIPVFQLSVDSSASPEIHFQIGQEISSFREKGVLILGSGNVVHNLSRINWGMQGGHPWAIEFDNYIKDKIISRDYQDVINYKSAGKSSEMSFPTPEHFFPLLYILGASNTGDRLTIFNDSCTLGSLSMTCYLFE